MAARQGKKRDRETAMPTSSSSAASKASNKKGRKEAKTAFKLPDDPGAVFAWLLGDAAKTFWKDVHEKKPLHGAHACWR